ncbi:MAG: class B sortase [Clostridia bacterium]|nr:class B sortase [Clostridia bacterium]
MEDYTPENLTSEKSNGSTSARTTGGIMTKIREKFGNKKTLYKVIIVIASLLLVFALVMLGITFFGGKKEDFSAYKNNNASIPDSSNPSADDLPLNPINFEALAEENSDAVAWIQIPGIDMIDYPIMQSADGEDDNFYLDHNWHGDKAREGAIYIQKLNNKAFTDPNTIIYGHNMLNGTMFGKLFDGSKKQYCNEEFFNEHRTIYVFTPGHVLKYEVISAFVYDDRHILNSFNFDLEEDRMEFFDTCTDPSSITKQVADGAELKSDDKIITLSTCTSNNAERFLVVGKLVSDIQTQ